MKVSVFYLPTPVFCKTTQERIVGGTVTDTNFLGQLGYVHKRRAVSAFVFGVPSIVAVVINYLKGRKQRGFPKSYFAGRFDVLVFAALVHHRRGPVHYNLAALLP